MPTPYLFSHDGNNGSGNTSGNSYNDVDNRVASGYNGDYASDDGDGEMASDGDKRNRHLAKIYMNCDLAPSSVHDYRLLREQNENIMRKMGSSSKGTPNSGGGKWILDLDARHRPLLDAVWAEARKLYNEGKLDGIQSMRVATGYFKNKNIGIAFHCAQANDREQILAWGRNLARHFHTFFHSFYYKGKLNGANSTRSKWGLVEAYVNTDLAPTSVEEYEYLYDASPEMMAKNKIKEGEVGKWIMFFDKSQLDQKWAEAKQLYRNGKLEGITQLKVSTAAPSPTASDPTKGVIIFFCGPASNEWKMRHYGTKLLEMMPYASPYGHMSYKSDAQTKLGTKATGQRVNHIYKIPVPKYPGEPIMNPTEGVGSSSSTHLESFHHHGERGGLGRGGGQGNRGGGNGGGGGGGGHGREVGEGRGRRRRLAFGGSNHRDESEKERRW